MQSSRTLAYSLLLLLGSGLQVVYGSAVPNAQPDPMITPAPQPPQRPFKLNEGPLVKRQATPLEVCGANFVMCDLEHCCKSGTYCYPQIDTATFQYSWSCNDLSELIGDYSAWQSSLSDILAEITESFSFNNDFSIPTQDTIFPSSNDFSDILGSDDSSNNGTRSGSGRNSSNDDSNGSGGLGTGAIIGIVAVVVIILAIVFAIFFIKRRKRRQANAAVAQPHVAGYPPPAQQQPIQQMQQQNLNQNPPNYFVANQPQMGPGGAYIDPAKQPFLQNQQPNPQYQHQPQPLPPNQYLPHQQQQGYYPPTQVPPQQQPQQHQQQQGQYHYPEGIAEAAGTETRLAPSASTKKPANTNPITPIPSLVPTVGGVGGARPEEYMYEMDTVRR